LNGETGFTSGDADQEAELERLYDRLATPSLKALFFHSVKLLPELISLWYKVADSEENMERTFRDKVEQLNEDIRRCVSLEVDSLTLGLEDGWWKDSMKVKELRASLESREHNAKLNERLERFSTHFVSFFATCASFLDKGHAKLAQFCAQLLINLYMDSFVTKDGMLSLEEEARIVKSLLSFHSSFILGMSTTCVNSISHILPVSISPSNPLPVHSQLQSLHSLALPDTDSP